MRRLNLRTNFTSTTNQRGVARVALRIVVMVLGVKGGVVRIALLGDADDAGDARARRSSSDRKRPESPFFMESRSMLRA